MDAAEMILRDYQDEAVNSLFDYWSRKQGNPLVVLPTGTGKSIVIGEFCRRALYWYPTTRILMLTHVKELISQNAAKLRSLWPDAPISIYSAGLGRKEFRRSIIFGGVQSVHKAVNLMGHIDVVLIDEAHLVSPEDETRYQEVVSELRKRNPYLRVAGFTATHWRKKGGELTNADKDGRTALFTDVCYSRIKPDDFRRFIAEGYLSPLVVPAHLKTKLDVSEVGMVGGDYNMKQLEEKVDNETISHSALRELCSYGQDRRAWVLFCTGISHAEHCADILNSWGIRTGVVHSKLPASERDETLRAWYGGKLRCVANNNVLTTGIDFPALDLVGMLRPTLSSALWVQMLGRGMRVSPGKTNCLVLDFAGNTMRLGPVDDPAIPGRPRPGGSGDAPVKICDACGNYNHTSVRFCEACGFEFPVQDKITSQASTQALMSADLPIIETFQVTHVAYYDWLSRAENRTIKVTYYCGIRYFNEYISIGGSGFAAHKANDWWRQRSAIEPPTDIDVALSMTSQLTVPTAIKVWVNKLYNGKPAPQIMDYEWHNAQAPLALQPPEWPRAFNG